jgi:hypothetical protein
MSENKSPAELESQMRKRALSAHEPASSPAELENQMRRAPSPPPLGDVNGQTDDPS